MVKVFNRQFTKQELLERVSSMAQIAGTRVFTYLEGKAAGVKAVEITAGEGLNFTVLLDRGMDIGDAYYRGIPVSWKSKVGVISPNFFENQGHQWLRSFYGGLLTTCGLIQVGEPCDDNGVFHGLHGRISNTPAERYWIDEYWEGDDYIIKVTGRMREAIIYHENIVLTREIKCILGERKIHIKDTVENESFQDSPFMIMYHVNVPFPIVGEHTRFLTSADSVDVLNTCDQDGAGDYSRASRPIHGYRYETFAHNMPMDKGEAYNAVVNDELELGVYLKYDPRVLPIGNQWKMLGQQDYVVAMEPANTYPVGIVEARDKGYLKMLKPREKVVIDLEIGILDGEEELKQFQKNLK